MKTAAQLRRQQRADVLKNRMALMSASAVQRIGVVDSCIHNRLNANSLCRCGFDPVLDDVPRDEVTICEYCKQAPCGCGATRT